MRDRIHAALGTLALATLLAACASVKKWILLYTRGDVAGRCIDRLTLSYQPVPARWDRVLLNFKSRFSSWQGRGCAPPRQ